MIDSTSNNVSQIKSPEARNLLMTGLKYLLFLQNLNLPNFINIPLMYAGIGAIVLAHRVR